MKLSLIFYYNEVSRGAGAQRAAVRATGYGLDPHSMKLNIYLNLYFLAIVSRESEERSVLTLDSLCLP